MVTIPVLTTVMMVACTVALILPLMLAGILTGRACLTLAVRMAFAMPLLNPPVIPLTKHQYM
jgi:hypothetical protein